MQVVLKQREILKKEIYILKKMEATEKVKKTKQSITIRSNEENPEPIELIAKSIIEISEAFEKINKSQLSRRAVVLLLQDLTKLGKNEIELVLNYAPKLKDYYLKSK